MILDNVVEWFDWVDAGADDVELLVRLEALNNIVKRLGIYETRWGWLSETIRNRRKMAHNWSKIYSFLVKVLERSKNWNESDRARSIWYVEDSLYHGRQAIWYLSPQCVMLIIPEKLSIDERLEQEWLEKTRR